MMNSIISTNQLVFLKGRSLVDGVMVVNDIVDFAKRANKDCLILKVDFEKAFDSVGWRFLDISWWELVCVCMSILVNDSPMEERLPICWKVVLVEKYGQKAADLLMSGSAWPRFASRWWKDFVNLEGWLAQNWFNTEVVRKNGNGTSTSFWRVAWRGMVSFMVKYPRISL